MEEIFGWFLIRDLARGIGLYSRYFFYKLVGKNRSIASLTNSSGNNKKSENKQLSQDIINAIVGTVIFCIFAILIASIVFK